MNGVASPVKSLPAVSVFNDTKNWYSDRPTRRAASRRPTPTRKISISSISAIGGFMQIEVSPAK